MAYLIFSPLLNASINTKLLWGNQNSPRTTYAIEVCFSTLITIFNNKNYFLKFHLISPEIIDNTIYIFRKIKKKWGFDIKVGICEVTYFGTVIYILIWTCSGITALEHNKLIRCLQIYVRARWIWQLKIQNYTNVF